MTKYTRTTPTAIEMKMAWNPSAMSANIPPLVMDTPGGSDNATIFSSISRPTCCVSSATMSPVMVAERRPSVRLMVTGPSFTTTSASSPRGAEPSGPAMIRLSTAPIPLAALRLPESTTSVTVSSMVIRVTVSPMRYWLSCRPTCLVLRPILARLRVVDLNGRLVARLRHVALDVDDLVELADRGRQFLGYCDDIVVIRSRDADFDTRCWRAASYLSDPDGPPTRCPVPL